LRDREDRQAERDTADPEQSEMPLPKPVRLLGVSLSSLQDEVQVEPQLDLPI